MKRAHKKASKTLIETSSMPFAFPLSSSFNGLERSTVVHSWIMQESSSFFEWYVRSKTTQDAMFQQMFVFQHLAKKLSF